MSIRLTSEISIVTVSTVVSTLESFKTPSAELVKQLDRCQKQLCRFVKPIHCRYLRGRVRRPISRWCTFSNYEPLVESRSSWLRRLVEFRALFSWLLEPLVEFRVLFSWLLEPLVEFPALFSCSRASCRISRSIFLASRTSCCMSSVTV